METKTIPGAALSEQVAQTARTALKRLVGRGLLPWPEAYKEEFWAVARSLEFSSILNRQGQELLSPETMQGFIEETEEVLGGVKNTVKEFVATARQHPHSDLWLDASLAGGPLCHASLPHWCRATASAAAAIPRTAGLSLLISSAKAVSASSTSLSTASLIASPRTFLKRITPRWSMT